MVLMKETESVYSCTTSRGLTESVYSCTTSRGPNEGNRVGVLTVVVKPHTFFANMEGLKKK
ncbi:hypothetical protein CCFV1_ORF021 [Cotesia congregata filamentous virus 1]|uniref:Uncharacterized protein n=1 Tax=Cotesia congregata filamentous virus 1 TaxID=3064291 RepID=A0ABC8QJK5_9VIRU|nr:hypothetical protein CCFV1_ORF021 [Cotesia congregata filamentous virus 1]